jgi:Xaa-Pro aminopeptidase
LENFQQSQKHDTRFMATGNLSFEIEEFSSKKASQNQQELPEKSTIGLDTSTIPHEDFLQISQELEGFVMKPITNLITTPHSDLDYSIISHNSTFSGVKWQEKVKILRDKLQKYHCSAIVVSSLSEIAYLLNVRSSDFKYEPVFRAYLIVTQNDVILYTNRSKVTLGPQIQFNYDTRINKCSSNNCVE